MSTRWAAAVATTPTDAPRSWPGAVVVALAVGAVLVQMAFPFTDGGTLTMMAASVLLLAGAAVGHALLTHGARAAAVLVVVAGGGGLLVEVVGVHTGVPFGAYSYAGTLGPQLGGVPVLVPLAWVMMAWPALQVGRLLGGDHRWRTAAAGAWALASWDVFLDPQMVDDGYWTWADPSPALPGVEDIPLTNFAGWLVVSLLMCAVLDRAIGRVARPAPLALAVVPLAVYLWTYASSVLAHAAFFGRPSVALVGSVLMGVVALPVALRLGRRR